MFIDDALNIDCSASLVGRCKCAKDPKSKSENQQNKKNKIKMFKAFWQYFQKEKSRNYFVLKLKKNAITKWAIK